MISRLIYRKSSRKYGKLEMTSQLSITMPPIDRISSQSYKNTANGMLPLKNVMSFTKNTKKLKQNLRIITKISKLLMMKRRRN